MITDIVKIALKEDMGRGDITSALTVSKNTKVKALIVAKSAGVVAGINIARDVFSLVDRKIKFRPAVKDGAAVKKGKIVARLNGPARGILTAERTALNLLGHLSGIASLTAEFKKRTRSYKVKIMDTRKTTPGMRLLEKYAVKAGGGANHRIGLWDQVLIKDNHIKIQKSKIKNQKLKDAIRFAKKRAPKGMKIEAEVGNLSEFKAALEAKPDIIMLDNMPIADMCKAVKINAGLVKLEASGNVTLANMRKIAATGVDMISIGALTHSANALDLSLEII
ncbi:MAG: carboxylating nicotinate-nucleotide diphosphorylase [Candidatus Omnitrophota bacterium]